MSDNTHSSPSARLFGRVIVALVIPFHTDGSVDWDAFTTHVEGMIRQGADGIVVSSTTGESSTLTDSEKVDLVRAAAEVSAGRARVLTGGGSNETAHAIEIARRSEAAGADANLIVTPYYNRPPQAGILAHFRAVADSTDLPVLLYDIPSRTGTAIAYETFLRAAEHPRILGVKDAVGDFGQVARLLTETDLLYFSGDDVNILPHLAVGATGLISVTANIAPRLYRQMVDAIDRSDLHSARSINAVLEPLVRAAMNHGPGTISTKYILHRLGYLPHPTVRLPLIEVDNVIRRDIESDLAKALCSTELNDLRTDLADLRGDAAGPS